jgi:AraC-like DNA-binding protein
MIFQHEDLSFQILGVGRFPHNEGTFSVKERPYAAISFRLSGDAYFEIGEKRLSSTQGCVTFIPAHTPYKVEYSGGESIVFHLLDCNYTTPENHNTCDVRRMEALFLHALKEWKETHSVLLAKANAYTALAQLDAETTIPADQTVLRCIKYIEAHYADPALTVETLCTLCHISRSSLQRKFKHFLDLAPKEYILKQRLALALALLMRRECSVKEVALASGFSDEKYFSRAFRAAFGYSPREAYHL